MPRGVAGRRQAGRQVKVEMTKNEEGSTNKARRRKMHRSAMSRPLFFFQCEQNRRIGLRTESSGMSRLENETDFS